MTVISSRTNPFFSVSTLPFQAPPFDKIEASDYQPAIDEGMRQQIAEIAAIIDDPAAPTFQNTLVALEQSGTLLSRVMHTFNAISGANTSDALQQLQEYEAPRLAAHGDAIYLDRRLFDRVETIYDQRDTLDLDAESYRLVQWYHDEFVGKGARLSEADKLTLKKLNEEESTLSTVFVNKLLAASKAGALELKNRADLAGMTDGEIAAIERPAKNGESDTTWVIPLHNTTQQPTLLSLGNRDVRNRLFNASWNRTERGDDNDTRKIVVRLAQLRAQQARLLGYASYAAWALEDQMAKTPDAALSFVRDLVPAATANARAEADDIQAMIASDGETFQLEPWDWEYYAERVRRARYDLDEEQLKQYFELDRVLRDGVFYSATQLYGITFTERNDIPVYHPDVRVFEVSDADGSPLTLFYCDYFARENKIGGAWMDNFVTQSKLLGTKPVIYNVANFSKPAAGQPALLSFDDVITMFHEFGHALHGFFADQEYPSLSGTSVARDFVELPSQFHEHWSTDPAVFANYAKHCTTGEPIPQSLSDRIKLASKFNQGYKLTEVLAAALLDLSWHTISADAPLQTVDEFETRSLIDNGVSLRAVPPRYRSSYFMHIWANGYSAGYYAYLWAEMLDADAYEWFTENGGLTRANGDRFRAMILSRGNTSDLATMYRDFRGRDPRIEPMLDGRGLRPTPKP
jgi:peptidyl-dipeptidase Dcp